LSGASTQTKQRKNKATIPKETIHLENKSSCKKITISTQQQQQKNQRHQKKKSEQEPHEQKDQDHQHDEEKSKSEASTRNKIMSIIPLMNKEEERKQEITLDKTWSKRIRNI
jgi:hypothetical protein